MASVLIPHDGGKGDEIALDERAITVGRDPQCDVVLQSGLVSRHHARIAFVDGEHRVTDLRSTNGTSVNDVAVQEQEPVALHAGDVVCFGDVVYTYQEQAHATIQAGAQRRIAHETVTVMFTDLQGHSALFEKLGDEAVYRLLEDHMAALRRHVAAHGGRTIKTEGDGLIATFSSVRRALECAVDIQRDTHDATVSETPLRVRIGINTGDAMAAAGDDLIGLVMVKAARLMSEAGGGQIYLSDVSRTLLGPATGLRISPVGTRELKGIAEPERLFELDWRDADR